MDHKLAHKYFPLVFEKYKESLEEKKKNFNMVYSQKSYKVRKIAKHFKHQKSFKEHQKATKAAEQWAHVSLATRVREHQKELIVRRIVKLHGDRAATQADKIVNGHGSFKGNKTLEKGCCPIERDRRHRSQKIGGGGDEDLDPSDKYGYVPYHEVGE